VEVEAAWDLGFVLGMRARGSLAACRAFPILRVPSAASRGAGNGGDEGGSAGGFVRRLRRAVEAGAAAWIGGQDDLCWAAHVAMRFRPKKLWSVGSLACQKYWVVLFALFIRFFGFA
jgi:hypothetical protein